MNHSLTASSPVSKRLSPRKMAFITGTLLLTSTGFICRILGFFYRIFMSRTIGAEGLGIYNMVHPIFSICFAVCAGSIQTALSQYVAANQTRGRAVFRTGLVIAMGMSFLLAWVIYGNAGFLAEKLLLEPRCAPYLPVMAVSVPFAALHACINGYYYGMQKARVPAFSQVAEQVIRMGAVFLIASIWLESGRQITVSLAVYGHLIGEMASAVFTVFCLGFFPPCKDGDSRRAPAIPLSFGATAAPLMALALPLMGNRLILNVLGSAEAIWIPNKLMSSGLTNSEALSVYGVLTSMALPFILFPSAITNSMAVLLLPTVAEAQADGNEARISMGSILNGLGRTSSTFFQNVFAMVIRLAFVLFAIPRYGILGYLWGMLVSELALALMSFLAVKRLVPFCWDTVNMIVKPVLLLLISIGMYLAFSQSCFWLKELPLFIMTAVQILFLSFSYMGLLLLFHKKRPLP